MKLKLYGIYGTLAHEKRPVYTDVRPTGEALACSEQITVEVPEQYPLSKNAMEETLIDIDGSTYLLQHVLTQYNGLPCLEWYDRGNFPHRVMFQIVNA